MNGSTLKKGVLAGFAATLVVSVLMAAKSAAGVMPDLDLARLLSGGGEDWVGWLAHFVVGTLVLGPLFALLAPRIPGTSCTAKAIVYACGAWLVMQLVVLPAAGLGMFGARYGFAAPALTFLLNVVYGVVLGAVYEQLRGAWRERSAARRAAGAPRTFA